MNFIVIRQSRIDVWPNTLHVQLTVRYENDTWTFEVSHADTNQAGYLSGRGKGKAIFNNPDSAFREYERLVSTNRSLEAMANNNKLNSL